MLHKFRNANNLAGRQYDPLFVYRSEILAQRLGPDDTLVLVDDFIGSGGQASENWPICSELVGEVGRVILVVVAAFHAGRSRIRSETELELFSNHDLSEAYNILSDRCRRFTAEEKRTLPAYCEHVAPNEPKGRGDCGLLVVFSHGCPNNSLPILHAANQRWEALFRRYD
jgi:hypothetical protein